MILDIQVAARAWRFVGARTTSEGAVLACQEITTPFTGAAMAAAVLDLPAPAADTSAALVGITSASTTLPVAEAMTLRGAVLVNAAGRCAVVVAPYLVVQPCGREYALTDTSADWWSAAWWPPTVTRTLPRNGAAGSRRGVAYGLVRWVGTALGATGVDYPPPPDPANPGLFFSPMPPVPTDPANPQLWLVDNRAGADINPTLAGLYVWLGLVSPLMPSPGLAGLYAMPSPTIDLLPDARLVSNGGPEGLYEWIWGML